MSRIDIRRLTNADELRGCTRDILRDVHALERMLAEGSIETGVRRIGAEQELFLVDDELRPANAALRVIELAGDARFTTEIALFNLEINLPPLPITRTVLADFHAQLAGAVAAADEAAHSAGVRVLLTGILPTLEVRDLTLESMTPRDRYRALNDAVMESTGGRVRLRLQGMDELLLEHDNVMLEACNTSFQVHYQVDPSDFAATYNVAQLIAAPVLAACVNSPLLLGRRLWKETRTALFHQSVDAEGLRHPREPAARVWFGDSWVKESVGELFRENVLRFRPLLGCESEDDPVDLLERGEMPPLRALQLHNGTVYRWNRPCYGVHDGKAHLRIECRYLPAGPTVIDEVANAALWIGAMVGGREVFGDVSERMSFETSRANFIAAARLGLDAGFKWLDGERIDAMHLVRERIIPAARSGLRELGIDETDADRYLDVIEHRTASGRTGADWIIEADLALRGRMSSARRMSVISAALDARAGEEKPVHEWAPLDGAEWIGAFARVEHCMTTDLFTLREDDAVDLAAFIMDDRGVRQILVEDGDQQLVGVISYRSVLHLLASGRLDALSSTVPVREIMVRDPATVRPETPTLEALRLLQDRNVTALPVTRDGRLVGILSERDLLPILASFFEARENAPAEDS